MTKDTNTIRLHDGRRLCYAEYGDQHKDKELVRTLGHLADRLVKPVGRKEKVHPDRRRKITEFQVRDKNDPEMHVAYPEF